MRPQIFVNLPVNDLKRSMDFYTAVGFTNNPAFTDETAACMVYSEEIFVMLLTHVKFQEFTSKAIADTRTSAAAILTLSTSGVDQLNAIMEKALAAGAREHAEAKDYGFMLQRSFEDPDGHNWELIYMDMSKVPQ